MARAATAFVEFEGDFSKVQRGANVQASGLESTFKSSFSRIAKFAKLALIGVGGGIAALGVFGLKAAGDFQQTRIAFEGILGSAKKAQTFLEGLRKFAAKTPFEFPELADAAKSLLAVGFNANDVIPIMTKLGNVAATLGVGGEAINGVVRALGQMKGKGKASAEELNQISEQIPGFSAVKAIAEELGITTQEAFKKMESGAINADTAVNAILNGMEKFPGAAGAMTRQSKTLNGVISTFKDTMRDALINGLEPLLPTLSKLVEKAAPLFGKLIGGAATGLASFIKLVQQFGSLIIIAFKVGFGGDSIKPIKGWLSIFARVGSVLRAMVELIRGDVARAGVLLGTAFGFTEDSTQVKGIIKAMTAIREAIASVTEFIVRNWKPILVAAAAALLIFISPVAAVVTAFTLLYLRSSAVRDIVGQIIGAIAAMIPFFVKLGKAIAGTIKWFIKNKDVAVALLAPLAALYLGLQALMFVLKVQKAFAAFRVAVLAVNAVLLANPIILVVAALVALGAAVVLAYRHFQPFHDAVDRAWQILQATFHWVQENWPLLLAILTGPIGLAVRFIIQHFEGIRDGIRTVIESIVNIIQNLPTRTAHAIGDVVKFFALLPLRLIGLHAKITVAVTRIAFAIVSGLVPAVGRAITDVVGFFVDLPGRILRLIPKVLTAALRIGKAILKGLVDGITGAVGLLDDVGKAVANAAIRFINGIIDELNDAFEFKVKGPGFLPDVTVNPPDIPHLPTFHSGGVFTSGGGQGLALLRNGEGVFTPEQMKALGSRSVDARTIVQGNVYGDSHLRKIFTDHDRELQLALAAGAR